MPPLIEHEESSDGEDEVPFRDPKATVKEEEEDPMEDAEGGADEGGSDEEEGDNGGKDEVFEVEKILDHHFEKDGTLLFNVKWVGYNRKSDLTWQGEETLQTASERLDEYFQSIGGRPVQGKKVVGKKARLSGATPETSASGKKRRLDDAGTSTPGTSTPGNKKWTPPAGSWENEVMGVDTIEQTQEDGLQVFLAWNNGHKSKHPIEVTYKRCPLKMLHFYEQHLVFKEGGGGKISNGA
ncbi:MAG: hypothetical protein M1812_007644 [Candelaria pacifica]|nr:MAG: hypothetical protein M1812_007644 [Candelaria pacifica]